MSKGASTVGAPRGKTMRFRASADQVSSIYDRIPPKTTFSAYVRMVLLEDKDGLDRAVRLAELRALAEIGNELRAFGHGLANSVEPHEVLPLLLALRRIEGLLAERLSPC